MSIELDATDIRIINLLQEKGKIRIKEIAEILGITNTPVHDRIKRLESQGYITGYTALVNKNKIGIKLVAFCSVTLESHHKEYLKQFESDIVNLEEVISCYHLAGMFDYLLKIYVKDMVDYQTFITDKLASLPNIGKVQSSFVMTEVKNERVIKVAN